MNWLTVRLPGCRIVYLPAGAPVEFERIRNNSPELRKADEMLAVHPRMRRILWRSDNPDWKIGPPGWEKKKKSHNFFYTVLHWSDGTDLSDLDHKVTAGLADESDFSACAPADFRTIRCLVCGTSIAVIMAGSRNGPICFGDETRIDDHKLYHHCPVCGQNSRWPLVADFVGQELWPSEWHIRAAPA